MGAVSLHVNDLDAMRDFYTDAIGLEVIDEDSESVSLGHTEPILHLQTIDAAADDPREAGLYHSAILYDDESALAQTLLQVAQFAPQAYQGSADHAVSLAFYLGDPEGNGVELYVDTPRDEWEWVDGHVTMGSAPLDPNAFLEEHLSADVDQEATMGHVHLRVGDTDEARTFYSDLLGFDVTAESQGAVFFSAAGYHHHLAANTWQSEGAGQRPESAGLSRLVVELPSAGDLSPIAERLEAAGVEHELGASELSVQDPWGTEVVFTAATAG